MDNEIELTTRPGARFAKRAALAAFGLLATPVAALAAEVAPLEGGADLLSLVLNLLLVIAAIVVFGWLYSRGPARLAGRGGALRVIQSHALGSRERMVLVQVGERQLLLGVAQGRISTLCELDEPIVEAAQPIESSFAERLRGLATPRNVASRDGEAAQ
jgi:flagellar protein FliO/FliZ